MSAHRWFEVDPCVGCEEVLQPYVDRILDEPELAVEALGVPDPQAIRVEAERHLDDCDYCAKRYRLEQRLREHVKREAAEPMPDELKRKLAALRTPLL